MCLHQNSGSGDRRSINTNEKEWLISQIDSYVYLEATLEAIVLPSGFNIDTLLPEGLGAAHDGAEEIHLTAGSGVAAADPSQVLISTRSDIRL